MGRRYRKHRRRRQEKNGTGSILLTVTIYGLFAYLLFSFFNIGIEKMISEEMLSWIVKNAAFNQIKIAGYVLESDRNILKQSNDHAVEMILTFVSEPVSEYKEKNIAVNVAGHNKVEFFLDNRMFIGYADETTRESDSITGENEWKLLKGESTEREVQVASASDNEAENQSDNASDTESKNPEQPSKADDSTDKTNTAKEGQTNGQKTENSRPAGNTAEMSLNKIKEINVSELTYDYLMNHFYTVVSSTTLRPEDIDAGKLMNIDMRLKTSNDKPQILIYHTHGQEGFTDSVSGKPETGIIGVGDYLVELLTKQYGYNVIHITDSFDYVNGVLDRSKAYDYAYEKIAGVLAENPSIEVVIDLHRDGVGEHTHLVTEVNGKQTAQIMFFNGISRLNDIGEIGYLYNPYRTENLAMSLQMKVLAEEYFSGFTRRNYIQAYQYNLHLRPKSMLIEAGAQTNSFEEVKNAMEPLAALLHMCIGDAVTEGE